MSLWVYESMNMNHEYESVKKVPRFVFVTVNYSKAISKCNHALVVILVIMVYHTPFAQLVWFWMLALARFCFLARSFADASRRQFSSHSDKRTWMTLSFGWDETKQAVGRTQILSDKIRDVDEILPENPEAQLGRSVAFVCCTTVSWLMMTLRFRFADSPYHYIMGPKNMFSSSLMNHRLQHFLSLSWWREYPKLVLVEAKRAWRSWWSRSQADISSCWEQGQRRLWIYPVNGHDRVRYHRGPFEKGEGRSSVPAPGSWNHSGGALGCSFDVKFWRVCFWQGVGNLCHWASVQAWGP